MTKLNIKNIFLGLSLISTSLFGQTFSFEVSEGFTVGNLNNQNTNWESSPIKNGGYIENQLISTENASDGSQSVKIAKETAYPQQKSIFVGANYKAVTATAVSDFKVQFDVLFNKSEKDVFHFNPVNFSGKKFVSLIQIDGNGNLALIQGTQGNYKLSKVNGVNFQSQKWYNIALEIDSSVKVYVDNQLVGTAILISNDVVDQFRFGHNNAGGFAYIDNVKFNNDANISVNDIKIKKDLRVFPNPVTGFLNIEISNSDKIETVNVFSIDGKILKTSFINGKVDFSKLPKGAYILQVKSKEKVYTKKIIKK